MGRRTDAKQAWPPPTLEAIHHHCEQLDLLPVGELFDTVVQEGSQLCKLSTKRGQAARAELVIAAFGNDEGALPVSAAGGHHSESSRVPAGYRYRRVAPCARHRPPTTQHVRTATDD